MDRFGRWAAVGVIGVMAAVAAGQEAAPKPGPITVEFKGGDIGAYVDALQGASDVPVNVILTGDAEQVPLPRIDLKGVSVNGAVHLLEHLSVRGFKVQVSSTPSGDGAPVYVVSGWNIEEQMLREQERQQRDAEHIKGLNAKGADIAVFSLKNIVCPPPGMQANSETVMSVDAVLTAVETAMDLGGDGEGQGEMKYHPDSGVLVVRGSGRQVDGVRGVLGEMQGTLDRRRVGLGDAAQRVSDVEHEAQMARIRLETAELEYGSMEKMYQQVAERFREGQISQTERDTAEVTLNRARGQMLQAKVEADRWQATLARQRQAMAAEAEEMSADQLRERIKQMEGELGRLRDRLKRLESGTR